MKKILYDFLKRVVGIYKLQRNDAPDITDCKNCHSQPGTHSLRQIGFDEAGRPVIYASFCQAVSHRNMSNDAVTHLIYTIENAIRSMQSGITQWVFVIDCTGK
ncbi:unnamed protein product [Heterobilharzia americana]|nr:unnamed protein product [Heterobilharzia americana]